MATVAATTVITALNSTEYATIKANIQNGTVFIPSNYTVTYDDAGLKITLTGPAVVRTDWTW